ncbi:serine-rich adhesin for platelets-like [Oppia nitens]|uniref:serine-rich adhesin for platelets-like n=1 Tax=Oppia nitens TaxID=1686743 RepID=UPI0023DA816D|nr:serine-rich adhesin for platelets-like [Oppia nitens]
MTDTVASGGVGGGGGGGGHHHPYHYAMNIGSTRCEPMLANSTAASMCLQRRRPQRQLDWTSIGSLDGLIAQVERTLNNDDSLDEELNTIATAKTTKQQSKTAVKTRIYSLSKVKKNEKKWLKDVILDGGGHQTDDESDVDLELLSSSSSSLSLSLSAANMKSDDCIREMLRFHRLDKKVRDDCRHQTAAADPQQLIQYQQHYNSTSLLNPIQDEFMVSSSSSMKTTTTTTATTTNKKPKKESHRNGRSKSTKTTTTSMSIKPTIITIPPITVITGTVADMIPIKSLYSEAAAAAAAITTTNSSSSSSRSSLSSALLIGTDPSPLLLLDDTTNSIKIATKLKKILNNDLNDIPYDTQLPKEIFQTDSPYVEQQQQQQQQLSTGTTTTTTTGSSSYVTNRLLTDNIFDTVDDMYSSTVQQKTLLLSSQPLPPTPTPSPLTHPHQQHQLITNFLIPNLPSVTSTTSSSSILLNNKQSMTTTTPMTMTMTSTSLPLVSDYQSSMNARRRRLWTEMARKDIPRAYKRRQIQRKQSLNNCQKIANWCHNDHHNSNNNRKRSLVHRKRLSIGVVSGGSSGGGCSVQYARARRLTKEMLDYWNRFDNKSINNKNCRFISISI